MHIISQDALDFKGQLLDLSKVQNICMGGLFIAMYIVLSRFNIRLSDILEIRFAFLALVMAGMYGGPMMGLVVGILSDIISTILSGYAFFPGFTVTYALLGFAFGLFLYRQRASVVRAIACGVFDFLIAQFLTTYWLVIMYGTPYAALFVTRLPKNLITLVMNPILIYVVVTAFSRVFHQLRLYAAN